MTSNLGAQYLSNLKDGEDAESVFNLVMDEVKKAFRPEFINRLDEIILFNRLSKKNIDGIVKIQLNQLQKRLEEKGYKVEWTKELYDYLAEKGYDPIYGARPLRRVIQRDVENLLANEIIAGKIMPDKKFKVDVKNDQVVVE